MSDITETINGIEFRYQSDGTWDKPSKTWTICTVDGELVTEEVYDKTRSDAIDAANVAYDLAEEARKDAGWKVITDTMQIFRDCSDRNIARLLEGDRS